MRLLLALLLAGCATPAPDDDDTANDDDATDDDDSAGDDDDATGDDDDSAASPNTVGVVLHTGGGFEGYTLFAPMTSTSTYLVDMDGRIVNEWSSDYRPGLSVYLLPGGDLLRAENIGTTADAPMRTGGSGGRVTLYSWDGDVVFQHDVFSESERQHHDVEWLDGSVLIVAWEAKSQAEAVAQGRDPISMEDGELWPTQVLEVATEGPAAGQVIWEWHLWEHLVQDLDPALPNYGVIADFPEKVDINHARNGRADWQHVNSVDYDAARDEVLLSSHHNNEIWVIDHSVADTSGPEGDLAFRWGNPAAHGAAGPQELFVQHDATFIGEGLPGEGNLLVFNNGTNRPLGDWSSVVEIEASWGGDWAGEVVWEWTDTPAEAFHAGRTSGAQRLPNGNTLISHGPHGTFTEVTAAGERVWEYVNPVVQGGPVAQGELPVDEQGNQVNGVFRARRYAGDGPELEGIELVPGDTVER